MNEPLEPSEEKAILINPDWAANALTRSKRFVLLPYEEQLVNILIEEALKNARITQADKGLSLAAAFDLLVAVEYYKRITNRGWVYCPTNGPLLVYPYTNTCTRCALSHEFHFNQANKPESGQIGQATSRLLCVFLDRLFALNHKELEIYRGNEPIDIIIYDKQKNIVLLAEVKAAPLTTLAVAVPSETLTETVDGIIVNLAHSPVDNSFLSSSLLHLLLPVAEDNKWTYRLINLGAKGTQDSKVWFYNQIGKVLSEDKNLFADYFRFWVKAFEAYKLGTRTNAGIG